MEHQHYMQINWQDGMKLNKNHFMQSDQFHIAQHAMSRALHLNVNNFGLLASTLNSKVPYDIRLALDGDFVVITKFRLSAVMLNGMYIHIDSDELGGNKIDQEVLPLKFKYTDFQERSFGLVIKVNSFKGIGFGKYDSEDFPIKRPLLMPFFEFAVAPLNKLKESFFGEDFFIIAKFDIEDRQLNIDETYIPPASSLLASKALKDFHITVLNNFNAIENYLIELSNKYAKRGSENFAQTMVSISNNLLIHLSLSKFEIKHKLINEPPIETIIKIKSFANIFNSILETRASIGKDGFMDVILKIFGNSINQFEELVKLVINLEYRHHNIYEAISITEYFLNTIMKVFKIMSEGESRQRNTPPGKKIDIYISK